MKNILEFLLCFFILIGVIVGLNATFEKYNNKPKSITLEQKVDKIINEYARKVIDNRCEIEAVWKLGKADHDKYYTGLKQIRCKNGDVISFVHGQVYRFEGILHSSVRPSEAIYYPKPGKDFEPLPADLVVKTYRARYKDYPKDGIEPGDLTNLYTERLDE